jgi:hypothetical protein
MSRRQPHYPTTSNQQRFEPVAGFGSTTAITSALSGIWTHDRTYQQFTQLDLLPNVRAILRAY